MNKYRIKVVGDSMYTVQQRIGFCWVSLWSGPSEHWARLNIERLVAYERTLGNAKSKPTRYIYVD